MEAPLQCDQATFLARLSPTGTRDDLAASVCSALRCAPARPDAGQQRPDSNLMTGAATWGRPATRQANGAYDPSSKGKGAGAMPRPSRSTAPRPRRDESARDMASIHSSELISLCDLGI